MGVSYDTYEAAKSGLKLLVNSKLMNQDIETKWLEPYLNVYFLLQNNNRYLRVKKISENTSYKQIYEKFSKFGILEFIRLYPNKAIIGYNSVCEAQMAQAALNKSE